MSRESLIILLGLVVLFLPSVGVPSAWKSYGSLAVGVALVVLGYSLRRSMYLRTLEKGDGERGTDSFTEHDGSTPRIVTEESDLVEEDTAAQ